MNQKNLRRLFVSFLAGTVMTVSLGMGAFAKEKEEKIEWDESIKFNKVLNMTNAVGASVPDVDFTFSIAPGTAVAATDTAPEILAGVGQPQVTTASFDVGANSTQQVTVKMNPAEFTKPGIYRYVITENALPSGDVYEDITSDANATRYLDVFVENDPQQDGKFVIKSSVLLESAATIQKNQDGTLTYGNVKSDGYENSYNTYDLTIEKNVAGARGDKTKSFEFEIQFKGPKNASFMCGNNKITLDAKGAGKTTVSLANGQSATIQGPPSCVEYTVVEKVKSNEGYTVTATLTTKAGETSTTTSKTVTNAATAATVEKQEVGGIDQTLTVINTRDSITVTGVITNITPYILIVGIAIAASIVFLHKKKYVEE